MATMKKHIIIGMAALGLMASCSSESEFHAVAESTINVTKAETSLGPNASEGFVTVDCVPVAAYTDEPSWLTATIDGNNVKLASLANDSRQSRNAKLVIKKAENDSVTLNVSQFGLVLTVDNADIVQANDDECSYTKTCSCNTAVEVTYAPDWATTTIDNEQGVMDVKLSANTTGHFRADYIKYKAAGVRDSFIVKQYDFDNDIAGEYVLAYNTFDDEFNVEFQTVRATLTSTELKVADWGYSFPIIVNDSIGGVDIRSNQYVGKFGKYFVYSAFISTEGDYYYGTESGVITAPFKYSEEYGTYGFFTGTAYNVNTGSEILSSPFLSMLLQAFSSKSSSPSNYVADLFWVASPYIMKVPEGEDEAETEAKAFSANHFDAKAMKRAGRLKSIR